MKIIAITEVKINNDILLFLMEFLTLYCKEESPIPIHIENVKKLPTNE